MAEIVSPESAQTDQPARPVDFGVREHRSLWGDAWRRLISSNTARLGMAICGIFLVTTVLAHFFWEYNPKTDLDYSLKLKPPNLVPNEEVQSIHPFGTDKLGRDIFTRVIHGGWNSLRVGVVAVTISLIIGGLFGLLAGFYESMAMGPVEKYIVQGLVGMLLAILPAWIAEAWWMLLLFAALGFLSAALDRWRPPRSLRFILFGLLGGLAGFLPAMLVSPYTALVTGVLGILVGLVLSFPLSGGVVSGSIMRGMDILLAFPGYLLAIAIVAFLGPGLDKGMIAIGIVGIPVYARLVRSSVLSVSRKEYVLAAQAIGEGHGRIMFRHIVPNILSPIIVQGTMGMAAAILSAAALGFLGLGAVPPQPEWGAMLGDSYKYLASGAWWAVVFPGIAIILAVLGFNLLGDGLRDALDPKLKI